MSSLSNGNTYGYDANGNMTARGVGGVSHVLEYDADNHMTRQSNSQNGYRYIYDGDGQLVVKINQTTGERSIYLASYAEVTYTGAAAATPTASATLSPTASRTPVPSRTSTLTPTKTRTPTRTATATKTNTPSRSRTPTKTATRITQTKTYTKTVVVQTLTPNRTRTATPTPTRTNTHTHTPTRTGTVTQTRTPSATATHTRTPTATPTSNPNLAGMAWKFYYLAGTERVAMRVMVGGSNQLYYLFTDHLGSTSEVRRADGSLHSRRYYTAFGAVRYTADGNNQPIDNLPTDRTYTGQREIEFGLVHYGARIYDPGITQFIQPDSIVPGVGEGGDSNAVGCLGSLTYSPLTVSYHENEILNQLNLENRTKLQDPNFRLPSVPTNPLAFNRYMYSVNNPIRYTDPTGHCPFCAAAVATFAAITPVGWVAIGFAIVGISLYYTVPGVRETVTNGIYEAGEAASNELQALFAKGEYVPPGLSGAERDAYREAVHAYKRAWGLAPKDNVPKNILDDIANAIKEGLKPGDAADAVDGPPEANLGE